MEIKVKCPCGSCYTFNEEPVSGRLRYPVKCPNCGVDGTSIANEYIRKSFSGELELERRRARVWWRRLLNRNEEDSCRPPRDTTEAVRPPNLFLGAVGAVIGGFLGMCGWYWLTKSTGWEIGIVAWAVGVLAGFGARVFVPSGGFGMASVAAVSALVAILGGQFLVLRNSIDQIVTISTGFAYEDAMSYAKRAIAADTDEKIRDLLAEENVSFGEADSKLTKSQQRYMMRGGWIFSNVMKEGTAPSFEDLLNAADPAEVSDKDVADFKAKELPELKELLQGKPPRQQFEGSLREMIFANFSLREMMLQSWSPYTLLWLFFGVGSAYKLAYNKSETEDV